MYKVCIIGGTGHYGYVLNGLVGQNDFELKGIAPGSVGENIENVEIKAREMGFKPEKFSDYRQMLDKCQPQIVAVACFFSDHARISIELIKRGIHVFCEKPLATTFEDFSVLKDTYQQSKIKLVAMFGLRYDPWFFTAWQAVRQGKIGEVRLMNAQKSYRLGTRGENYKKREIYGGTIPWVGSHAIDWLYWFSGQRFESVFASHSTKFNQNHGELESSALCHFTFSNQVFGSANIDYLRPLKAPSHGDDRIRVAGSKGVIEVREEKVFLINDEQDGIIELPLLPRQQSFADFIKHIKGENKCLVSARDSFIITQACLKARLSADEKKIVYFQD